jgi:hypothetical protein
VDIPYFSPEKIPNKKIVKINAVKVTEKEVSDATKEIAFYLFGLMTDRSLGKSNLFIIISGEPWLLKKVKQKLREIGEDQVSEGKKRRRAKIY